MVDWIDSPRVSRPYVVLTTIKQMGFQYKRRMSSEQRLMLDIQTLESEIPGPMTPFRKSKHFLIQTHNRDTLKKGRLVKEPVFRPGAPDRKAFGKVS